MSVEASVIVPTYNRPEQIKACVEALQRQKDCAIEIIVVDDGSPSPLPELPAAPHRLVSLRQDNAGPAKARNVGAGRARAPLLIFTDDDCRPDPGWAAAFIAADRDTQTPTLFGGQTLNAVEGNIFAQTSQEMNDYLTAKTDTAERFFASNNIAMPRKQFLEIGGFDTGYRRAAGEDRAFCRSWATAGHEARSVPQAQLEHHHHLTFRGFWRQHRNYGFGAARFHGDATAAPFRPLARLGFYGGLVASPLARSLSFGAVLRSGLVVLAQLATVQGFREARRLR